MPSLYAVQYHDDGTVAGIAPTEPDVPARIRRRIVRVLPPPPVRPIVPYIQIVHDRASLEIQRGCSHGCRFCHAGVVYRPVRERPMPEVLAAVDALLRNTGHEEVALVALSSSDYTDIDVLLGELLARHRAQQISFSLPSLRIDSFSVRLAALTQERRKTGLTFAPEAGSQRLRDVINKGVTDDDLLQHGPGRVRDRLATHQAVLHDGPAHRDRRGHRGHRAAGASSAGHRPAVGRARGRGERQRLDVRAQAVHAVPVDAAARPTRRS